MVINRWNNLKQLMADTSIDVCQFSRELKRKEKEEQTKRQFFKKFRFRSHEGVYNCGENGKFMTPMTSQPPP